MLNKRNRVISKIVTYVSLVFFSAICIFPFLWMLLSALKPKTEIRTATPSLLIHAPTLENFKRVLVDVGFLQYIKNSFFVSIVACVLSMIIAVMAGYALSRYYKMKLVKTSNLAMMLSQMIPGVLLLVPLYLIMQKMQILESYTSLILAYTTFVIPLCTFMMSSFFDTVPLALEEAAEIDGCNKAQTIFKIILPLSLPSLVSTGLYAFINAWNEYTVALTLISDDLNKPLTVGINIFNGYNMIEWQYLFSASLFAIAPVVVLFAIIEKNLVSGLASGGVKG